MHTVCVRSAHERSRLVSVAVGKYRPLTMFFATMLQVFQRKKLAFELDGDALTETTLL